MNKVRLPIRRVFGVTSLRRLNAEFEYVVRDAEEHVRVLRRRPADLAAQLAVCRSLRKAKVHYKDLLRANRAPYYPSRANKLLAVATRAESLLQPGCCSDVARAIRRHAKEIARAPRACLPAEHVA